MNNTDPKQRFLLMIAMALTFVLILNYFLPPPTPPTPPAVQQTAAEPGERPAAPLPAAALPGAPAAPTAAPVEAAPFQPTGVHTVKVRVGREGRNEHGYAAEFSTIGAGLTKYRLLGFYRVPENYTPENEIVLLDHLAKGSDSLRVDTLTTGQTRGELRTYGVRETPYQLVEIPADAEVEPPADPTVRRGENLVFRTVVQGWEVTKTYTFPKSEEDGANSDFTFRVSLAWRNLTGENRLLTYRLAGPAGMLADDDSPNFGIINFLTARQPAVSASTVEVERKALGGLAKEKGMSDQDNRANLAWVGAKNRFFAALMAVDNGQVPNTNGARRRLFVANEDLLPRAKDILANLKAQPQATGAIPLMEDILLTVEPGTVAAGAEHQSSYLFYAGPAVDHWMEQADSRFHGVVSYTWSYFDFISRWLVRFLTFLDGILGNYGLAIIVVTLIVKLLLHPLNRKSFVSMNKMSKLAPMMKELQKKYGNDKARLQQEMSKFYQQHGVSMAGGCLPVFLQLPIFFALYGAFSQGFSMRHAPFISGWINDLSKPDSVYNFASPLPLVGWTTISLLPIIYLFLQFWQMSMQPKPSDPQQAQQQKIMKFMPLMFVFIFYTMPAGLVLYFTVSALAGVAESAWMRKVLLPRLGLGDAPTPGDGGAAVPAPVQAGKGMTDVPSHAKKKKR